MERKQYQPSYYWWLGAALLVLLAVGSVFDFQISQSLYSGNETVFGKVFAALGEIPSFIGVAAGGVYLLTVQPKSKVKNAFFKLFGAGLTTAAAAVSYTQSVEALPELSLLVAVFTAAGFVLAIVFFGRVYQSCDRAQALRFALIVFFFCIVTLAVVNGAKYVWARPRMRLIFQNGEVVFKNWWQPGRAQRTLFVAQGIDAKEFRSFPSGHTAGAACSLFLMLLPMLRGKGSVHTGFWISVIFTALVAFSRITMGAHFLTDVTLSWGIAFLAYLLVSYLFCGDTKGYRIAEKLLA